jgi:tRNA A-37 threonylcarbamoyl transferase component Bud32
LKSCPQCKRVYPDDAGFCPVDGVGLQFASLVPIGVSDDPRIGTRLCDRYELRRVVADGGMGRVYEGIDKQTNSRIAVKILHDDVAKDEIARERFKREYEMSKRLHESSPTGLHDYIVRVDDFQQDPKSGAWLLVMEFLDGEELRVILKRDKTLSPERLIRMLSQAAIGLDAAHQIPIVHRDLKPDNLFLCGTREGDVTKLLDFGSVKDKSKDAKKLTVLGTTIGSPYYMAPEQAQGLDTLDARADVFALAAITYECICGTVPFAGTNGPSILLAIMTKDPEPPSIAGAKQKSPPPPALDNVIEEALAKNPNIRTKTVGAFADAVGKAYGLDGDHKQWATAPQADLAARLASAPRARAIDVGVDPFAAPDPFAQPVAALAGAGAIGGASVGVSASAAPRLAMDAAFQSSREADYEASTAAAGTPSGARPPWLVAVLVGVAALVLGGGIALFAVLK